MGKDICSGAHDCEQKNRGDIKGKNGEDDPSLGPCKGTVGGVAGGSGSWGKSKFECSEDCIFFHLDQVKEGRAGWRTLKKTCRGQGIKVSFQVSVDSGGVTRATSDRWMIGARAKEKRFKSGARPGNGRDSFA